MFLQVINLEIKTWSNEYYDIMEVLKYHFSTAGTLRLIWIQTNTSRTII